MTTPAEELAARVYEAYHRARKQLERIGLSMSASIVYYAEAAYWEAWNVYGYTGTIEEWRALVEHQVGR